jgi:Fur family peroxide stress response transcriptional regulator
MLIRDRCPGISLGTVYRNLNFLVDNKKLRKISIPNGSDRFDENVSKHHHMICRNCGKMFDVEIPQRELNRITNFIHNRTGFLVDTSDITLEGVCRMCSKEPEKELSEKI